MKCTSLSAHVIKAAARDEDVMAAKIIDGVAVARKMRQECRARVETLKSANGLTPGSRSSWSGKIRLRALRPQQDQGLRRGGHPLLPVRFSRRHDPGDQVLEEIERAQRRPGVHGILVSFRCRLHSTCIGCCAISVDKDVDGFHLYNVGGLVVGQHRVSALHALRCRETPGARRHRGGGKNVVVVGASNIVGKPMALMLMQQDATVCICHAKTRDLAQFTLLADILVVAAGQAESDHSADGEHRRRGDRCRHQPLAQRQAGRRRRFRGCAARRPPTSPRCRAVSGR